MAEVETIHENSTAMWETRRSARTGLRCPVLLTVHEDMKDQIRLTRGAINGELLDISATGAGMEIDTFLPKGALVRTDWPMEILSVDGEEKLAGRMVVCALVAYARGGPDRFRLGLIFKDLPETYTKIIESFVIVAERRQFPRVPVT